MSGFIKEAGTCNAPMWCAGMPAGLCGEPAYGVQIAGMMGCFLRLIWCDLVHRGGDIKHDPSGKINWQCRKCGRWCDPVILTNDKEPG